MKMLFSLTAGLLGAALLSGAASAQSCLGPQDARTPEQVADIVRSLPELVGSAARSGPGLSAAVRDAAASDIGALGAITSVPAPGDARVSRMVGAGLAAAANLCAGRNPEAGLRIQQAVVASGNAELAQAFQAMTQDMRTAAIDAELASSRPPSNTAGVGQNRGLPGAFGGGSFRAADPLRGNGATPTFNPFGSISGGSGGGSSFTIVGSTPPTMSVSPSR